MNKDKLFKYILIIINIILVILLIIVCVNKEPKKGENESSSNEEKVKEEKKYVKHVSYDKLFTIETPAVYEEVAKNSLNEKGIIELNDENNSSYVLVVMTDKKDLNETFNTYKKSVFKQKEDFYKTKITNYESLEVNGHAAEYGEIYYTDPNGINTYIRACAIETDHYFGQIILWTLASNEDDVKDDFNEIISSFREVEDTK